MTKPGEGGGSAHNPTIKTTPNPYPKKPGADSGHPEKDESEPKE
jgi:hypothetical protein